ncbi:MAG: hypothetical protein JW955_02335 [Sedimentisphaerales bacterium]|nr:hypothetical protein [Sedimentisphaerales bacterium]
MATDATAQQIESMFSGLHRQSAAKALPKPGTLAAQLSQIVDRANSNITTVQQATLSFFATAAVEMWHRSIHSLLISASLTKASPLWACVSGYYSSHYAVRGLAHLLGFFQLHSKKRIIQVEVKAGRYLCHICRKQRGDREHKFYWSIVKDHTRFAGDPFFTKNEEGQPRSDSAHRSKANYADHVDQFPLFEVLNEAYLKQRIRTIASMELSDAPIPRIDAYPDTDSVQLVAYHRVVKFRSLVDEVLGGSNRFWTANRRPGWCRDFVDFQVVTPKYTSVYKDLS